MGERFIRKFQIPDAAKKYEHFFFNEQEIAFAEQMDKDIFTREDIGKLVGENTEAFIRSSYQRGLISIVDQEKGTWRLNNFYGSLDVFVVTQQEKYRTIPEADREKIDAWYFEAFYQGLNPDTAVRPTPDQILTLPEVLDFIDRQDRPVYLNYCDCRSLRGECGFPVRTCITYKNGINTFAHRGLSKQISKDQAKEIVKAADHAGLMHTVNPNGICNCCGDCCYLFRGQQRRGSFGFWPQSLHIVELKPDTCIGCGKCARRCHFGVFTKKDKTIEINPRACVGCGICATECPTGSLTMKGRD